MFTACEGIIATLTLAGDGIECCDVRSWMVIMTIPQSVQPVAYLIICAYIMGADFVWNSVVCNLLKEEKRDIYIHIGSRHMSLLSYQALTMVSQQIMNSIPRILNSDSRDSFT